MHIIFSWSSIISWLLFTCDIGLIAYLTLRAYRDGELSLQLLHYVVPRRVLAGLQLIFLRSGHPRPVRGTLFRAACQLNIRWRVATGEGEACILPVGWLGGFLMFTLVERPFGINGVGLCVVDTL